MFGIRLVDLGKEQYLPLLLTADPSEEKVRAYLRTGALYVLSVDGEEKCAAVVTIEDDAVCELQNLATYESEQGKGYASTMVATLCFKYAQGFSVMRLGTGEDAVAFYEKLGFVRAGVDRGYFVREYPEPIIDNGKQLVDRVLLEKKLVAGCCCHE